MKTIEQIAYKAIAILSWVFFSIVTLMFVAIAIYALICMFTGDGIMGFAGALGASFCAFISWNLRHIN